MKDVECPYCGYDQEINHDDGYGYEEGVLHQQECVKCDKVFAFTASISFYHEAFKADCLNGGEHKYEPTHTFPKEYSRMQCSECGEERKCTEQEMTELLTETTRP